MPTFELLLPLGAFAFYLYDCGALLYDDELLLLHDGRRWRAEAGSGQFLFRRRACLPGLLQPWQAIYRAQWRDSPRPEPAAAALPTAGECVPPLPGLIALRVLCTLMLVLMLPVLPLVSLAYGAGWAMLGVFAAYYALIAAALAYIATRRRRWRVSGRAYVALALDALACAPFAANLVRRVSATQPLAHDGVECARVLCGPDERRALLDALRARLDDRAAAQGGDGAAVARLRARRLQLEEMLA